MSFDISWYYGCHKDNGMEMYNSESHNICCARYAISTPSVITSAWSHVKATCVCPCGGGEGELIEEDTPTDKETRVPRHVV